LGPECGAYCPSATIRNLGEYEGDLNIDERIVADLLTACRAVAEKVQSLPRVT
jgi:hypothetical protein